MNNSIKTDTRGTGSSSAVKQLRYWIAGALVLGAAFVMGSVLLAGKATNAGLPDLLGKSQPPLPKGALQVDDLKSDPKGYTGSLWCVASWQSSHPTIHIWWA